MRNKNLFIIYNSLCFLLGSYVYSQHGSKDSLDYLTFEDLQERYNRDIYDDTLNLIYATKYVNLAKKLDDTENIIIGYGLIAESKIYQKSLVYLDSMIYLSKHKYKKRLAYSYYKKGGIHYDNKKLKEALENYILAYKTVDRNNVELFSYIQYCIALIKSTQGKYEEALPVFLATETFFKNSSNPYNYLIYLYSIIEIYINLNELEKAEHYMNIGLKMALKEKNDVFIARMKTSRGKIFFKRGRYQEAINDLKSTLKILKYKLNDFTNYAENCYFIGNSYLKKGQVDLSIVYFKKVDSIFIVKKYIYPDVVLSYNHLISHYKKEKDLINTLYYTNQLLKADSLISINKEYITNKSNKDYDVPELLIDKEKIINELENNKTKTYALITLLILCIIFLPFYFKKEKQRELIKQKRFFEEFIVNEKNKNVEQISKLESNESINANINSSIDDKIASDLLFQLYSFEKERRYLNKEITLDSLSKELKTNMNYLSKVINEKKGCSFPVYINNLRIDYAIHLLRTERKYRHYSIKSLAETVGYNNIQSFTRAFFSRTNVKASFFIKELIKRNLD